MSPSTETERDWALDGTRNARDLGGIPLESGGYTAFRRFLRTDAPFALSERDRAGLLRAGFDRVLDLRSDMEAAAAPTCLSADARFTVRRVALAGAPIESIAADYALTQSRMCGVLERVCRENPALCYDALVAREENLLRFWEMFLKEYGGAGEYMLRIGLTEERTARLKEKLRG